MKSSELLRLLLNAGWTPEREKGSHVKLVHPDRTDFIIFPSHGSKEVGKGLEMKIKKHRQVYDLFFRITTGLNREKSYLTDFMKKFKVIVEKTSTGYSAYAHKYPVYATGENVKDLVDSMIEAFNFHFDESGEKMTVSKKNLELSFSIPSLFQLYPINVRHFADRIGMNYTLLSQYVQGRKKPSEKQAGKIVEGLQEVGRELSEVNIF